MLVCGVAISILFVFFLPRDGEFLLFSLFSYTFSSFLHYLINSYILNVSTSNRRYPKRLFLLRRSRVGALLPPSKKSLWAEAMITMLCQMFDADSHAVFCYHFSVKHDTFSADRPHLSQSLLRDRPFPTVRRPSKTQLYFCK